MHTVQHAWAVTSRDTLLLAYEGSRVARYRIRDGELLYKAHVTSPWLRLSREQALQHFALNTVVAEWLNIWIGWKVSNFGEQSAIRKMA